MAFDPFGNPTGPADLSIFGKQTSGFGSYVLPKTGPAIYFDCVTSEQVIRGAEITEFPVERGANISDHYRVKTNEVKLEVFVSQEPINEYVHREGQGFWGAQTLNLPAYPSSSPLTSVAKTIANPVGSVLNAIGSLIDGSNRPVVASPVLQFPAPFDSLANLLEALDAIRARAGLVDIVTRSALYSGFVIGDVVTNRTKETGTGTKVSIEFKRIVTVSTKQVAAPEPVHPKDVPPVNKGAQAPTDPGQQQSLASAIIGAIIGGP